MSTQKEAERLDALEQRVEELESLHDALRRKVKGLESDDGGEPGGGSSRWDHYDKHVLSNLKPGQRVNISKLKVSYRDAGLKKSSTIKQRAKSLTRNGPFEKSGKFEWKYVGSD